MQHGPAMLMGSMSKKRAAYRVALKSKQQIAEGAYQFVFEKPEEFRINAGQHVRMTFIKPPETDSKGNSRFFSIASSPQEADLVFAMRMRDTAFKRVMERMQNGEKVPIEMLLHSTCRHIGSSAYKHSNIEVIPIYEFHEVGSFAYMMTANSLSSLR